MTDKEKQIVKKMNLKYKFVGSEVVIQGKISLTDYNKIMNKKPGTKTPTKPPKPPVWAQTLIADMAIIKSSQAAQGNQMNVMQGQITAQGNQMNVMQGQLTTQGNQITSIQNDVTEMKNTPTMKKELENTI